MVFVVFSKLPQDLKKYLNFVTMTKKLIFKYYCLILIYYLYLLKKAELLEAVRRRRKVQNDDDSDDIDEDDLGLPRSPSMHSPTITTGHDLLLSKVTCNSNIFLFHLF